MQNQSNVTENNASGMRILRQVIDTTLPFIGTGILLNVAFFKYEFQDAAFVVLGVFLMEVGLWKLAHKLLPNQRKYHALRTQADQFLALVRQLHRVALRAKENDTPENSQAVETIRQKMHHMVDRMVAVADKTDADLAAAVKLAQKDVADVAT